MVFGERLRKLRQGYGMTQQQLAEVLGVAKSVISYYENDGRFPSYDILIKIVNYFHVTSDYLLGIGHKQVVDVEGLSEDDINVVVQVAEALKQKNNALIAQKRRLPESWE